MSSPIMSRQNKPGDTTESRVVLRGRSPSHSPSKPKPPAGTECYICGREYRGARMDMHIKACKRRYEASQENKPQGERAPLPIEPADFNTKALSIDHEFQRKLEEPMKSRMQPSTSAQDVTKPYEDLRYQ